jgi:NitT/TauT family transport system substrate-binding protein
METLSPHLETLTTRRQALRAAGGGGAALLGAGLLAACGSTSSASTSAAATTSGKMTTISDQLGWLKTSQWAGFYAAIENGYYTDEGIDENLIAGGPNIVASTVVANGHADVGEDDNQTVLQAIGKGDPLVIYATLYQRSPYAIISLASDPINSLKDFANKKIALPPATNTYLNPLLEKAGVDLKSISFVPATNVAQLANKEVQGYFGYETDEGVELEQMGIKIVMVSNESLGLQSYGNVLITTKDYLAKNKPLLIKYLRATIKGWEYAIAHPAAMGPLTVNKFAAPGDNVKVETSQAVAQVPLVKNPAGIMRITYPQMQAVITPMIQAKSLAKPLTAHEVMTTEILDAVYQGQTSLPL